MNDDHVKDQLCARIEEMEQERDALAEKARTLIGEWRNGQFGDTAAQAESWRESAAQYARNEDFYHGIVRQIGELFGEEARTSDDGSVQDDVLALKVPELVEALAAHVERLRGAFKKGYQQDFTWTWVKEVLDEAPITSLARLKAEWQAEAVSEFAFHHLGGHEQEVAEIYASRLRRQAEGGEV